MGTFNLALTGIDASNPIPGVFSEVRYAQGESGGDNGPKKVLIIAPKTSAGSITADTQVVGPLSSEQDFITYAGTGSPAHRIGKRVLSIAKNALVYLVCPTEATGSAAVDKVTISFSSGSNPTAAGVATIYICNVACSYGYTTSDTATTIGAGLVAAINAKTELPVTASNVAGVITITGRIAGTELNSIRFRAEVTASTNVVTTVTADTAFGASGAGGAAIGVGTISYTAALATIATQKYHYIIAHSQEGTPIGALMTQVNTQANPDTGYRQKVVLGGALTPSSATTLASGANLNAARAQFVNQEEAPEEHYMLAATVGAVRVLYELGDPSYNFDGFGLREGQTLPVARPYNDSAIPTTAELITMLNNGVTPIGVADNGKAYIVRSVTTRCKNGSVYDYRARDTSVVVIGDKFTDDVATKLSNGPWTKVTDDPSSNNAKQPNGDFATPKRVKAYCETEVRRYVDNGWFDPAKLDTTLESMQVGLDPQNKSRMNIRIPAYSAILLHQTGLLVAESSPSI